MTTIPTSLSVGPESSTGSADDQLEAAVEIVATTLGSGYQLLGGEVADFLTIHHERPITAEEVRRLLSSDAVGAILEACEVQLGHTSVFDAERHELVDSYYDEIARRQQATELAAEKADAVARQARQAETERLLLFSGAHYNPFR